MSASNRIRGQLRVEEDAGTMPLTLGAGLNAEPAR